MGILETALANLGKHNTAIAMGAETIRGVHERQDEKMARAADRGERMWHRLAKEFAEGQQREHEIALQEDTQAHEERLLGTELGARRGMETRRLTHERGIEERRNELQRELEEERRELEKLLLKNELEWTEEDHRLQRDLEWRIALLRKEIAQLQAGGTEREEGPGGLLDMFHNEMTKLQQTNPQWKWDDAAMRFAYEGDVTDDLISQTKELLFTNIDSDPTYTPDERQALKTFIENNFMQAIQPVEEDDGGGGGRDWSFEWPEGRTYETPDFQRPSQARGVERDVVETIERLKDAPLTEEERGAVSYAETLTQMGGIPADVKQDNLRAAEELLDPIEEKYARSVEEPPAPSGEWVRERIGTGGQKEGPDWEGFEQRLNEATGREEEENLSPLERLYRRNRGR